MKFNRFNQTLVYKNTLKKNINNAIERTVNELKKNIEKFLKTI